jgi:DNA polymerase III alpha subunit
VVAFCLGIHHVDPNAHNLYFERFLSLERRDPPDIDLDLCSHRRDEVINYVYQRYGADHVAMVCTYATLQPRSALREVAKVYGLSEAYRRAARDLPRFYPALQQAHAAQEQLAEHALCSSVKRSR